MVFMFLLAANTQIAQLALLHGYLCMKVHSCMNGIGSVSFFPLCACLRTHAFVWWEVDLANTFLFEYPNYTACVIHGLLQSFQALAICLQPVLKSFSPAQLNEFRSSGQPTSTAIPTNSLEVTGVNSLIHFRR